MGRSIHDYAVAFAPIPLCTPNSITAFTDAQHASLPRHHIWHPICLSSDEEAAGL